jgi:hypothetical protein
MAQVVMAASGSYKTIVCRRRSSIGRSVRLRSPAGTARPFLTSLELSFRAAARLVSDNAAPQPNRHFPLWPSLLCTRETIDGEQFSSRERTRRSAFVLVCTFKQRNRHEEPRNGDTGCRRDSDIHGLRPKRFRRLKDRFKHQLLWDGRSARRRSLEPEHIVRQQWWRIKRAIEICPCAAQRLWRQHFTGECGPKCRLSGPAPKTRIEAYSRVKGSRRGREIQSASTPFA